MCCITVILEHHYWSKIEQYLFTTIIHHASLYNCNWRSGSPGLIKPVDRLKIGLKIEKDGTVLMMIPHREVIETTDD